jgi:competence ComEA-like helix-hairpin-helix protein
MRETKSPASKSEASAIIVITVALALLAVACGKAARSSSNTAPYNVVSPKAEQGSVVNINTASPQELQRLPGVGAVIAERIIAHREQYGPFRRAEHLMMVRGVSDRKFRQLRAMIVTE